MNGADTFEADARRARLRYVCDDEPGFRRRRRGRGFSYHDAAGRLVRDRETRARLASLAIPPAWTDVWICADERGHLQATGRDARGRKQYRYHPRWREVRDATKFDHLLVLGGVLPVLRRRVDAGLRRRSLDREKVLSAVVTLLETTCIRIGNVEYSRENDAYGLTTLRKRHVDLAATRIRFAFRGKGGQERRVTVRNRRLARVVARCEELPGYRLFQYLDDAGERRAVDSSDVNDYLREATGEDLTAKDFRTWWGSVHALALLRSVEPAETEAAANRQVVEAIDQVAHQLSNTRAVCRDAYVHPAIPQAFFENALDARIGPQPLRARVWMDVEEVALLRFLESLAGEER